MNKRFKINKIAKLMCLSEETIRKSLNTIKLESIIEFTEKNETKFIY